jgi:predicted histidine transporter YuiF (NhaC family)
MTKIIRDFISFCVMATLIFVVISLSFTSVTGSSGAGIRYWNLHWIVVRQDIWNTSLSHIYTGTLAVLIAFSFCLTWVLSKLLKVLHAKKNDTAWLLSIVLIVIYIVAATVPNFALS